MDVSEFVSIGGKLVEMGGRLAALKEERLVLDAKIAELEEELAPLVSRHTELVSSVMGVAMPKTSAAPVALPPTPPVANERLVLINRIKGFIKNAEASDEGISATQIADALRADPTEVREIMRTLNVGA